MTHGGDLVTHGGDLVTHGGGAAKGNTSVGTMVTVPVARVTPTRAPVATVVNRALVAPRHSIQMQAGHRARIDTAEMGTMSRLTRAIRAQRASITTRDAGGAQPRRRAQTARPTHTPPLRAASRAPHARRTSAVVQVGRSVTQFFAPAANTCRTMRAPLALQGSSPVAMMRSRRALSAPKTR